MLYEVMIKKMD